MTGLQGGVRSGHAVRIYVTREELEKLTREAKGSGKSVSTWGREELLKRVGEDPATGSNTHQK